MENKIIIAITQFKLAKGVDEKAFLEISEAAQTAFFKKADGLMSRELTKGEDGVWVDITHWESLAKAEKAEKELAQNPAGLKLIQACDQPSFKLVHVEQVRAYRL